MTEKQVLITGGAGFIGSHLSELMLNRGYRVIALDNLSTGRLENIQHLIKLAGFQFVHETINNAQVLDRIVSESDLVIHLAAAVGVQLIVKDPVHTIETNILGTDLLLKTANRYGRKVMLASTSEVYGKGISIPFREEDDRLIGPTTRSRWSYATSKAMDEFLGFAYNQQYGLPVVIMRFFNTVGPRQTGRYGMVIPRFVRQAISNESLTVYGTGRQTRCFADVADVIEAIASLAELPEAVGQIFNIGADDEISIHELAKRVIALADSSSDIQFVPYDQAYGPGFEDMERRVPSLDKLHAFIDYRPSRTLNETLHRVIDYECERTAKE